MIDDDPNILRPVKDKLVNASFEIFTVATGRETPVVIDHKGILYLAIADINMPGMDGF